MLPLSIPAGVPSSLLQLPTTRRIVGPNRSTTHPTTPSVTLHPNQITTGIGKGYVTAKAESTPLNSYRSSRTRAMLVKDVPSAHQSTRVVSEPVLGSPSRLASAPSAARKETSLYRPT